MKKFVLFVILIISSSLYAQEVLDKVVAVVDNEIIMKSELDFQTNQFAAQHNLNPSDPNLAKQVLNSIINEKLLYAQAQLDSVVVTDEDVNKRVDYQLDQFMQQFGSREKVEQAYGMSLSKIKSVLRDNTRKGLMSQLLIQKKFGQVESSRREVVDFFNTYRDSLGLIPEKYTIAHIFRIPKASEKVKESSRKLAEALLDSLKAGADFASLATKYSEDPGSAKQGGDLGFSKRGRLVPEFEAAAFALENGQISGVVESPFGFHIIQLIEKRGETIHARHILIKVKSDEDADLKTIEFLSDLRDSVMRGKGKFEDFAKKYSEDKETAKLGGLLGSFDVGQLDKSLLEVVNPMKSGEISYPKRMELGPSIYGYHIVYLIKKTPQHKPDINQDYAEIKQIADYTKQEKMKAKWIDELKSSIFWEVRL
ncbi:MAG: parvulin peptidyl-prolyl isomerase [Ignavibacteria bacterium]|jgi:peptidyl-prolyl cis-trans isomerase SurA|nr:parvulin peptidyl-prolyl isomerase [Ignavibacteria bacterium]MCU7502413.1 parvulin peptidyl-prolyl isomerase [Ignavibacteria bacterium]MCU7515022.1 parvulin peptidyl-prolyl isomerase [Ignavibacteria bacterium]